MDDRALIAIMAAILLTTPNELCVTPRDAAEKAHLILIEANAVIKRATR